jgi:uncharacterized protein YyaL (SSP411 family)
MPNRLARETSPYLRQHADNPVEWYAWGEEAFRAAREQDRPIHLSVGYAACHWCHVMAHESFEDPAIAEVMNQRFINIKVDRQERPDVDDVYQKVVQMMGQGGGWPLTVFLSPAGEPFFGGTYFPPEDRYGRPGFRRVLLALSDAWRTRREEILGNCREFVRGFGALEARMRGDADPDPDAPAEAARLFAENTDPVHGGLGGAPKFPNPSCYDLVLRIHHRTREPMLLDAVVRTLEGMARGGIYDHLGGGFARYSVDDHWAVPHFEKMLYDNGQLLALYADVHRVAPNPTWRRVIDETIAYLARDLAHPEGAFYASEDADSEGEEGRFYVFDPAEVRAVLGGGADAELFCRAYGVTERGNFEHGRTVLHRASSLDPLEEAHLFALRERMLEARSRRVRPGRDENILCGWNALAIHGLCAAYQATGTAETLSRARRAADFIAERMMTPEGHLYRVWKDGAARVPGFLDDYAFLAGALIDLYESSFERLYLTRAMALIDQILTRFWDDDGPYFTPAGGEPLIHRPRAPQDNAWPSGTSESVLALARLAELTGQERYRAPVERVFRVYGQAMSQSPFGFSHLLAALEFVRRGPLAVVLAGDRQAARPLVEVAHRTYHPARTLAFAEDVPTGQGRGPQNGQPAAFVCRNQTCDAPVVTPEALGRALAASAPPA